MNAIVVDDEFNVLSLTFNIVSSCNDITSVKAFDNYKDALDYVRNNPLDLAFLDINMRGLNGMELASEILKLQPRCNIIFCTGYEDYAISAFKIHASGYLMKPISKEDVQHEIDYIKGRMEKNVFVKCFGNFEIYIKGEKMNFNRKKTKELLAFLIDRRGSGVTANEIVSILFENENKAKSHNYLRQIIFDLRETLKKYNISNIFEQKNFYYSIKTDFIECDYYLFLETGYPKFCGEYMSEYSWAENTCAYLWNL